MSKINLFLLDDLNNKIGEVNIVKPNSFKDLINVLKSKIKYLPELYEIFIIDKNNNEEIINDEKYNIIDDILFIRKINTNNLDKSIFHINYDKLSESGQEILDEKYSCLLCTIIIKNENPYLCYNCQKLFHEKCLKDWDKNCKKQENDLTCPICRNNLPIEKWNKKLDYEENRKENANLMNKMNLYKIKNNMNNNINLINERKINELKADNTYKSELIQKYEIYINKTLFILNNILNQLNLIVSSIDFENSNNQKNTIKNAQLSYENLEVVNISNLIDERLKNIKYYIQNNYQKEKEFSQIINSLSTKFNLSITEVKELLNVLLENILINNERSNKNNDENSINKDNRIDNKKIGNIQNNNKNTKNDLEIIINQIMQNNIDGDSINFTDKNKRNFSFLNKKKKNFEIYEDNFNNKRPKVNNNEHKNKINLIYITDSNFHYNIFGKTFVENNENNIDLIINGIDSKIVETCKLNKGENEITILIKDKLTNLSCMFENCKTLKNIEELEYLDVKEINDFSCMFKNCSILSDINPLKHWDVSNANNLSCMFEGCEHLLDISPLENWDVSNCIDFSCMFKNCLLLSDISPLKNWNVSNANNLSGMFYECSKISNLYGLHNWNISNVNDLSFMFNNCSNLSDIKSLLFWNISKVTIFYSMFSRCPKLIDLKPISNWNITKEHLGIE